MIHYVKEKKKLCTFPIYSIISLFIFFQLGFILFSSSQAIVYLSTVYFYLCLSPQRSSAMHSWMQFTSAFLLMIVILI